MKMQQMATFQDAAASLAAIYALPGSSIKFKRLGRTIVYHVN
jgi:hypothetical protein